MPPRLATSWATLTQAPLERFPPPKATPPPSDDEDEEMEAEEEIDAEEEEFPLNPEQVAILASFETARREEETRGLHTIILRETNTKIQHRIMEISRDSARVEEPVCQLMAAELHATAKLHAQNVAETATLKQSRIAMVESYCESAS